MADPPDYEETEGDSQRGPPIGTPRWVKVFGIVALVVVLLFVTLLLTRGPHGPSRHAGAGDGDAPRPGVAEHRGPRR